MPTKPTFRVSKLVKIEKNTQVKVEKQVNKSDWDKTCMVFESKICIHLARDSDLAYTTEEDLLKISRNFFFVTDKGLVEIISLHRK